MLIKSNKSNKHHIYVWVIWYKSSLDQRSIATGHVYQSNSARCLFRNYYLRDRENSFGRHIVCMLSTLCCELCKLNSWTLFTQLLTVTTQWSKTRLAHDATFDHWFEFKIKCARWLFQRINVNINNSVRDIISKNKCKCRLLRPRHHCIIPTNWAIGHSKRCRIVSTSFQHGTSFLPCWLPSKTPEALGVIAN